MRKTLILAASAAALFVPTVQVMAQSNVVGNTMAPVTENNATATPAGAGQYTFDQLIGFLNSAEVPDAASPPMVGADLEGIAEGSEVLITPVTELEGWTGDRAELDKLISSHGQELGDFRAEIQARPDLISDIEGAGSTVDKVLIVSNSGTGKYTFYVDAP